MSTRTKHAAYPMDWDGILVRGTTDPYLALKYVVETDGDSHYMMEHLTAAAPIDPDDELHPYDVMVLADWLHAMAAKGKPGWYRMNVCPPDHPDGWTWQLGEPTGPGPGNFQGVYFQ